MYTASDAEIKEVPMELIKPEVVPLKQEKLLKKTLFPNDSEVVQYEEIKLRPIDEPPYEYQYINGRRRGETLRANGAATVRAIVVDMDETDLHIAALVANSGRPNPADEAEHFAYLRNKKRMSVKQISLATNYTVTVVKQRLKMFDDLTKSAFDQLKSGEIILATAHELSRMSKQKQAYLLTKHDKLTPNVVKEEYRKTQAKQIDLLIPNNEVPETVTLSAEMMNQIFNDQVVEIMWNGEKIHLCRCEKLDD